jgi:hypothetical protein
MKDELERTEKDMIVACFIVAQLWLLGDDGDYGDNDDRSILLEVLRSSTRRFYRDFLSVGQESDPGLQE